MATLKEIKTRIASVRSTLKITTAMKMVSSAKLHHAQQAIGNMLPYQRKLREMLENLQGAESVMSSSEGKSGRAAVIAFSSNSSLCGAFNANACRKLNETVCSLKDDGYQVDVYPVGKKIAEGAAKAGFDIVGDWNAIAEKPSYKALADMAEAMMGDFVSGKYSRVELVYNHFESSACQPSVRETFLPACPVSTDSRKENDFILEPGKKELLEELLPKVMNLKLYSVGLDADAAGHAARVVAMQMASDNAEKLLEELSLEYNKRRQQAITSELLDIVGGSMA